MTLRGCRGRRITTGNAHRDGIPTVGELAERRLVKQIEDIHDTSIARSIPPTGRCRQIRSRARTLRKSTTLRRKPTGTGFINVT